MADLIMSLKGSRRLVFVLFTVLTVLDSITAINVHIMEVQSYINGLVEEFDNNPKDRKFASVIDPPLCLNSLRKGDFLLPKVLICSPGEQFELKMRCPIHKDVILKPWRWAKEVTNNGKRETARMVYDFYGNVILVQKIFICYRGRLCHKMMPITPDVWNVMPQVLQEFFPIVLTEKADTQKLCTIS